MNCLYCSKETINTKYCCLACGNKARIPQSRIVYDVHPHICPECSSKIPYSKRFSNKFCSRSCAAKFNNPLKPKKIKLVKESLLERKLKEFNLGKVWTRHTLRKLLIITCGNKCSICNIPNTWENKVLTLIVDHIDGNVANNLPINLRLICPNCNSQTPTFCGRNKGKGRESRGFKRGR
jgi:DNA-directed RNA polymerase subunit RPC12/RpoP